MQITYPFNVSGNYTFDSDKIELSGGVAKLKLYGYSGLSFNEDFADDTDFTYDNTKVEFTGGRAQQKDKRPTDASFYAGYNSGSLNANWSNDSLVPINTVGTPTVVSNKLNLKGGGIKYVDYNGDLNADSQQVGCIRFAYIPNYGPAPAATTSILLISKEHGSNVNLIEISQRTSSAMRLDIKDGSGVAIISFADLGKWFPVAGTTYIFELNWDITTGATRLFIDGVQQGATQTQTGTRSSDIGLLRIGSSASGTLSINAEYDDIVVFSAVQHTAAHAGELPYSYSQTIYVESKVDLPDFAYAGTGSVKTLDSLTTTESGSPRYIIEGKYWTGSAWATSDGTYAQANAKATINTNIATLTVLGETTISVSAVFADSGTQSYVNDLTLGYTEQKYSIDNPTIKPVGTIDADALDAFEAIATAAGSDAVKYVIEVDGINKYWDGSEWATSTGYSQSNTAAEIETNKSSLDISDGAEIKPVAYLHSNDGSTTPELDTIVITFSFFSPAPADPSECIVYGYVIDSAGNRIENATIKALPLRASFASSLGFLVIPETEETTSNAQGYWELTLIRSAEVDLGLKYDFEIITPAYTYLAAGKTVPDSATARFGDL